MFCVHCGATLKAATKFCIECGGAIADASAAQAALVVPTDRTPVVQPVPAQPKGMRAAMGNRTALVTAAVVLGVAVLTGVGFALSKIYSGGNPLGSLLANLLPEKLPQTYGLFVWNGGDWVELSRGKTTTIEIDIAEAPKFLIHGKAIEKMTQSFTLRRMYFLRNSIIQNRDGSKKVIEKSIRNWNLRERAGPLEGRFAPVNGRLEMVMWIPAGKLEQGAYQPSISLQKQGAFFIGKNALRENLDQSEYCVDQILTRRFAGESAIPAQYLACSLSVAELGSSAGGSSRTIDAQWFGKWSTADGRKTVYFAETKVNITEALQAGGEFRQELKWISGSKIGDDQFGQPGGSTTPAALMARYQTALAEFKKGNSDYDATSLERTRQAIAPLAPGSYKLVTGQAEGHCRIWDWVLGQDFIVEISDCKQGFHAQLLNKAK